MRFGRFATFDFLTPTKICFENLFRTNFGFFVIFGRTDLRKGVSEAKFDGQADFDVKKCLAPPKSVENREKPKKNPKKILKKNFRRQKIESCKSSETRFPEVSRRSERSSRGERKIFCRATRRLNSIDGYKRNVAISQKWPDLSKSDSSAYPFLWILLQNAFLLWPNT